MSLHGATIVITGASSGIGRAAAESLAAQGAQLAVVGRNPERTAAVAKQVGGTAFLANFDELDQVRELAEALLNKYERIDVLANNAGGMISSRAITVDGFERTIQVNHYAPFLLTQLLLPRLRESRARIIGTASLAHHFANLRIDDLDRGFERYFGGWRSYGASKLATILAMRELAKREASTGVSAYSMHPGHVSTEFGDRSRLVALSRVNGGKLGLSPEQGAAPLIHLASATTIDAPSGSYFARFSVNDRMSAAARDTSRDAALWDATMAALKLSNAEPRPALRRREGATTGADACAASSGGAPAGPRATEARVHRPAFR